MGINESTSTNPINSSQIPHSSLENYASPLLIDTDDKNFRLFYKKYLLMVKNRCRAILHNNDDAEEMAQKVFFSIFKLYSKGKFDILQPKPELYLNRAASNMSKNEIKRERREQNKIYDFVTKEGINWTISNIENGRVIWEQYIIDNGYEQVEAEIIVKAILAEQDEVTQEIFYYKYVEGMILEQIGELVGLSRGTVDNRVKKLEKQVKLSLEKRKK